MGYKHSCATVSWGHDKKGCDPLPEVTNKRPYNSFQATSYKDQKLGSDNVNVAGPGFELTMNDNT